MTQITRIYIDLDDTICDYSTAHAAALVASPSVPYPQSLPGFYLNLVPLPNAIEYIQALRGTDGVEVYILTAPSVHNPLSYTEKRLWVEKHLGFDMCANLIICNDKSLLKGDVLIDDCHAGRGQDSFEGKLIVYGNSVCPDWHAAMGLLQDVMTADSVKTSEVELTDVVVSTPFVGFLYIPQRKEAAVHHSKNYTVEATRNALMSTIRSCIYDELNDHAAVIAITNEPMTLTQLADFKPFQYEVSFGEYGVVGILTDHTDAYINEVVPSHQPYATMKHFAGSKVQFPTWNITNYGNLQTLVVLSLFNSGHTHDEVRELLRHDFTLRCLATSQVFTLKDGPPIAVGAECPPPSGKYTVTLGGYGVVGILEDYAGVFVANPKR